MSFDGFIVYALDTNEEVDRIECTRDGAMRERVEEGLAMRVDFERFRFEDTRWGEPA